MNQTRTFWDHSLIIAIPFSRWGAVPYIVDPILFPNGILSKVVPESCDQGDAEPVRIHPYQQACLWRQEMEHDSGITKANIAAREGISRARVTQIMNLLELPEVIQEELRNLPSPLGIHFFAERCLRQIVACRDVAMQLRKWQEMVCDCRILVRM